MSRFYLKIAYVNVREKKKIQQNQVSSAVSRCGVWRERVSVSPDTRGQCTVHIMTCDVELRSLS